MQQLSFEFPTLEKYFLGDFIVSSANKLAFEFIVNYSPENPKLPKIFAIFAPNLSGKTYLAHIWQKKFSAEFLDLSKLKNTNLVKLIKNDGFYIIEDIENVKNQKILLEIFNLITEKGAHLMLTSARDIKKIDYSIKDLHSRLKNVFEIEIKSPDDDLIKMLLIKNFAAKQLKVSDTALDFLIKNLHRNFVEIFNVVKLLEFYSLEKKRNITIPLIKEILKQNQTIDL